MQERNRRKADGSCVQPTMCGCHLSVAASFTKQHVRILLEAVVQDFIRASEIYFIVVSKNRKYLYAEKADLTGRVDIPPFHTNLTR